MRLALTLTLLATPAAAWEFSPTPVCTLSHETPEASVTVTHDPRQPEPYAIAVTTQGGWPEAPVFSIRFDGPRGNTISTPRHRLSADGTTLTVTDRGFGNVLDGLEFNDSATATAGGASVTLPLDGAAPAVQAFRACADAVLS
jgi:hypothetical protein